MQGWVKKMDNIVNKNINYREDKPYYIYIHTCPNYMVYVGLSKNPKQRWNNGKGYINNKRFYEAIQTFGWENIKHEIVAETNYGWIARKIEKSLISRFKKYGKAYNIVNEDKPAYASKRKTPLKKVGKFNKDGQLIKIYNSASEAWKDGNTCAQNIQDCCRGKTKTAGGHVWKYL